MSSLKAKWIRRIEKLNARPLHAEALAEAVAEFGMSTQEWRAAHLGMVITQMWGQWSAIVLRSICKKGPPRFKDRNVSIEGLLESMSGDAETLLTVVRQAELKAWLRRRPSADAIRSKLGREKKKLLSACGEGSRRYRSDSCSRRERRLTSHWQSDGRVGRRAPSRAGR